MGIGIVLSIAGIGIATFVSSIARDTMRRTSALKD